MSLHDLGFQITYAGYDLEKMAIRDSLVLSQGCEFHRVFLDICGYKELITPGQKWWNISLETSRELPPEGDVLLKLADDTQAEGQARLDCTSFSHSFIDHSVYSYMLYPLGDAKRIVNPEHEAIKVMIRDKEEQSRRTERGRRKTELRTRIDAFSQIKGDWVSVRCYSFDNEEVDHFSMKKALSAAIRMLDWGYCDSVSVTCDGIEIFSNDDLWLLEEVKWR